MTKVAILWHMHQPYYEDLATGEHILPWVRLHALKDYYGMVALLREFPSVRMTFNLVPSLLVQLQAFADNRARDRHLELGLKPADRLTGDDRAFLVSNFFHVQRERMIDPYPRYRELFEKRRAAGERSAATLRSDARAFTEADLRDLQVWHKLVWLDPFYLDDARIRDLVAKDRGFSEADKATLRQVELELLRAVIPEYRAAAERGQIEISASPFYHPILPLLCDTDVYLRTHPHSRMPRQRFRHPEDAAEQLTRASEYIQQLFGAKPAGLWPSEGSVSEAIVPLARAAGFTWMASDELILARTTGQTLTRDGEGYLDQPDGLYRPYRVWSEQADIACLFRDHALSDLIGFVYASWDGDAAARDFAGRLREAGRRFAARTGGAEATISIILDGENAWEHYAGGGRPFLRALYRELSTDPELRTVTCGEACAEAADPLTSLFPGSWIDGDFYIWIGHPDDHKAWSQLAEARQALQSTPDPGVDEADLARAREELLIAEGSDWFWWYGDDHSSAHDFEFDDLFRRHLRNVHRTLRKAIPEELFVTNITTAERTVDLSHPLGLLHPTIDGEETSYFEWIGAALFDIQPTAGVMHQTSDRRLSVVSAIRFGFDFDRLHLRVDFVRRAADLLSKRMEIALNFLTPAGLRLTVSLQGGEAAATLWNRSDDGRWDPQACQGVVVAVAEIMELSLPLDQIGSPAPGDAISFFLSVREDGSEIERHPSQRPIDVEIPSEDFESVNWTA